MSPLTFSRILFVLFIANEVYVASRSSKAEMAEIKVAPITALSFLLVLVPWIFPLQIPNLLGWVAVALQVTGLLLEISAEVQLIRANSFAVSSSAGKNIQTSGAYRWLEDPIYIGILLQILGWAFWTPIVLIPLLMMYLLVRQMVARERMYLANLGATHRGVDSVLWT